MSNADNQIVQSPKNVVKPQPGGQTRFLSSSAFEVLFGGAAGPGKSWALIIDALGLQFRATKLAKAAIDIPEYRAVLFRRETTQLSKLIDEGKKYYTQFNATFVSHRAGEPGASFTFPSGAKIFLCHMQNEDDKENHQGIEYQYVGFDELTQFTLTQYLYLFSRLRSTIQGLFCRVRATTNPTGSGLLWVKKRFIQDLEPYATHYYLPDKDMTVNPAGKKVEKGTKNAKGRAYIPGKLAENKILMDSDPDYASNIMALGGAYAKALLESDWDAFSGDFFPFKRDTMIIQPIEIPINWGLVGSLDPGFSSPCSFGLTAKDLEGNLYRVATYYERQRSPHEHAEAIKNFIAECKLTGGRMPNYIVSGLDAWAKKDRYSIAAVDTTLSDVFALQGLSLIPAKTDRKLGWWAVKDVMQSNKYFVFDIYNEPLINEITAAQSGVDPEDITGKGNDPNVSDHALDEQRYSIMSMYTPAQQKKDNRPAWLIEHEKRIKRKKAHTGFMGA